MTHEGGLGVVLALILIVGVPFYIAGYVSARWGEMRRKKWNPASLRRPAAGIPFGLFLLLFPLALFIGGLIAMLTFGAIANEFGAKDAPGYWGSLGVATGLLAIFGNSRPSGK